VLRIFLG